MLFEEKGIDDYLFKFQYDNTLSEHRLQQLKLELGHLNSNMIIL